MNYTNQQPPAPPCPALGLTATLLVAAALLGESLTFYVELVMLLTFAGAGIAFGSTRASTAGAERAVAAVPLLLIALI